MTTRGESPDQAPDQAPEPAGAGGRAEAGAAAATRVDRLNTGGLIYGTIVSAVALAIGSVHGDTGGDIVNAMAASVIIYWLAHVYTATLSGRRRDDQVPLRRRLRHAFRHEAAILGGGLPALILFVPLLLAGISLLVDVMAALGAVIAALAVEAILAGRQAGVTGWRLPAESASAVVFGALVALLMAALHV